MNDIEVTIQPFTERGRLRSCPPSEAAVAERLFSVKSPLYRRQTYQVETNEPMLFSLDTDRLLMAIEFIIPRCVWRVIPPRTPPAAPDVVSLAFSEQTVRHGVFDLDADVVTDISYTYALVRFGTHEARMHWVTLSEHCLALIADNRLKGFYITCMS